MSCELRLDARRLLLAWHIDRHYSFARQRQRQSQTTQLASKTLAAHFGIARTRVLRKYLARGCAAYALCWTGFAARLRWISTPHRFILPGAHTLRHCA